MTWLRPGAPRDARPRIVTLLGLAALGLLGAVAPVAAQETTTSIAPTTTTTTTTGGPPATDPTTTAPAPTDPPPPTDPASTEPGPTDPTGTDSSGTDPGKTEPPAPGEDTSTTIDPLLEEPPGEPVPETEETVPPPDGSYGGQQAFEPSEVLWSSVHAAEAKLVEADAVQVDAIEAVRELRRTRKKLRLERAELGTEERRAAAELEAAEKVLEERAVAAFVGNDSASAAVIASMRTADHDQVLDLRARWVLAEAALGADQKAIDDYVTLRRGLGAELVGIVDELRHVERELLKAEVAAAEAAMVVDQAIDELEAFAAGSTIYIDGVQFPVAPGYDLPLIDSWGFPRMPGTPDEHWHEGIDIFAPAGTPLVAAERGVVTRISNGRLGGLSLWLRGQSGADWYYAHLRDYAPGLHVGQLVEAGDPLGTVGNTGNAATTPPHLHLQLHPDGADPVNPYPLLHVISERDQGFLNPGG